MNRAIGTLFIIVSAASFGTLAIFGRYAYAAGLDTYTLLFLRFGIAALLMTAFLAFRGASWPRGKTMVQLIGMGAIGYVGQSFCYLTAIQYASAGLVALLLYLYPAFVAFLSALIFKEKFTRLKITALGMALLGAALTANPQGGQWPGITFAIAAAAIYSIYIIVGTDVLKKVSALESSAVIFASAGLVYGALTSIHGPHFPKTNGGWVVVAAVILVSTIIPVVTFLSGLQRIGPTDASMLSTVEPVVTVLLAAWLFGEVLNPIILIGGGLILSAVLLLTRSELKAAPEAVT